MPSKSPKPYSLKVDALDPTCTTFTLPKVGGTRLFHDVNRILSLVAEHQGGRACVGESDQDAFNRLHALAEELQRTLKIEPEDGEPA